MDKPKIYLETTIFNFPFAPDLPGYKKHKEDTLEILSRIKAGVYKPYTSIYTAAEINGTNAEVKRKQMKSLIDEYHIEILPQSAEAERLADLYVAEGAVPPGFPTDALHIAITTVYGLDFIVSLNFEHIAREWTVKKVKAVNNREGYRVIGIYKPMEVLAL
jgi:hypothetical protein